MTETPAEARPEADRPTDRRTVVVGAVVAVLIALAAGSAFWLFSLGSGDAGEGVTEHETERTVATLPQPDEDPEPVDDHFPAIEGLEPHEPADDLVAGLEGRLRPAGGEFADTRHRELRDGEEPVALISLLRVHDDEEALALRHDALHGVGELFEQVGDAEIANEAVVRARRVDGTALLWLPDRVSVVVVSAVDEERAEEVLGKIVTSVRGEPHDDDDDAAAARTR